jgi:hypothetical protein
MTVCTNAIPILGRQLLARHRADRFVGLFVERCVRFAPG